MRQGRDLVRLSWRGLTYRPFRGYNVRLAANKIGRRQCAPATEYPPPHERPHTRRQSAGYRRR